MQSSHRDPSTKFDDTRKWGVILIAIGLFYLISMSGIFSFFSEFLWGFAFIAGGLVFLYQFITGLQTRWWAAIPGCALAGIGATILASAILPAPLEPLTGTVFLWALSCGFWAIFLTNPRRWWAVIPGGVLMTLGMVAAVDSIGFDLLNGGSLFFLGLAATFALVGLLSTFTGENLRWAFIPAAIMAVMGLVVVTPFRGAANFIWPVALLLAGLYLLQKGGRRGQLPVIETTLAPANGPLAAAQTDVTAKPASQPVAAETAVAVVAEPVPLMAPPVSSQPADWQV